MGNRFVKKFYKNYKFLEKYGFTFEANPYNLSQPSFKNKHGEIIETYTEHGYKEIFVQINGWKKVINLEEDYKKYFRKSTFLKPRHKLFKELFEYFCFTNNNFYGLPITFNQKEQINHKNKKVKIDNKKIKKFNIVKPANENVRFNLTFTWIIFGILIIQLILLAVNRAVTNYQAYYIIGIFIYLFTIIYSIFLSIVFFKQKQIIFGLYSLLCPLPIYFIRYHQLSKFGDYLLMFYIMFGIMLFLIKVILKIKSKIEDNLIVLSLILYYPILRFIIRTIYISILIHFDHDVPAFVFIVSAAIGAIALVITIVFGKGKIKKKEYVGSIIGSLALGFMIPLFTYIIGIRYTNYLFDSSSYYLNEYRIFDKEIKVSTGRYRTKHYYFMVAVDNDFEKIEVPKIMYYNYDNQELLVLRKYKGFYHKEYYIIIDEKLEKIKDK